jgi:hypothetical protein
MGSVVDPSERSVGEGMKKSVVLAVLCAVSLAGCATAKSRFEGLSAGATKTQVIQAMGACPNSSLERGEYVALTYNNKMLSFFQWQASTYTFILKDGQVVEFGEGTAAPAGTDVAPTFVLQPPAKG